MCTVLSGDVRLSDTADREEKPGTLWVIGHQVNSDQRISPADGWACRASD